MALSVFVKTDKIIAFNLHLHAKTPFLFNVDVMCLLLSTKHSALIYQASNINHSLQRSGLISVKSNI